MRLKASQASKRSQSQQKLPLNPFKKKFLSLLDSMMSMPDDSIHESIDGIDLGTTEKVKPTAVQLVSAIEIR
jgi:hypothetical protein